jgi:thiol:disulfide interchange protein
MAQTMGEGSPWKGLVIREHSGRTTWRAPITTTRADAGAPRGSVTVQLCRDNACIPPESQKFTAVVPAAAQAPVATATRGADAAGAPAARLLATHVPKTGHSAVEAVFTTTQSPFRLTVRLLPENGWHLYAPAASATTAVGQGKPTVVSATLPEGVRLAEVRARGVRAAGSAELAAAGAVEGPIELEAVLVADAPPAPGTAFELRLGFQTCADTSCDPPQGVRLSATLPPSGSSPGIEFAALRYGEAARGAVPVVAEAAAGPVAPAVEPAPGTPEPTVAAAPRSAGPEIAAVPAATPALVAPAASLSLPTALLFGLFGGLILNLMPCVLPVLGLKLMSFAQQSGRARREVFQMNLWYCLGVYAVFFALATASVAANLGLGNANLAWGEQFTSTTFNIVMIGIVFAFALAFLGIWELPIPGFIGEQAGHVQSREGPVGAFLKGVLSTVLATPCSGPFLGPVFGFTLTQSTAVTYAVFGAIATGMALPYIVVGLFPGLVRFLPKPGAWMATFKELLGFVMLGTVAFFFSFLARDWFVPTFVLLIGIWMACWWVGRAQEARGIAGFGRWVQAAALGAAVGGAALVGLAPSSSEIEWERPFSRARLATLRDSGQTVMVDFTADWCLTCKMNLANAIETRKVSAAIKRNRVAPLLADYTDGSDEIKQMLASLQSRSIPVLAIFPSARPGEPLPEPIVLRDLITERDVLAALEAAGPSRSTGPEVRAAAAPVAVPGR